jgi:predicted amidohydrolase YtcJ
VGEYSADVLGRGETLLEVRSWPGRTCLAVLVSAAVAWVCLSARLVAQDSGDRSADTIIVHAKIYTVNQKQPWAESVAIRRGKIVAAGSEKESLAYRGANTKVIDAKGHLVLPGFRDCHIHFLDGSLSLLQVNLDRARTLEEIQHQVGAYAKAHPELPWILGRGWQYTVFGASSLPNKSYLDEVIPDRPVYLESFDGHSWWANSKALKLAGIKADSADPPGGRFVRDPVSGEPTGAVKEDAADDIVQRAIPRPSREQVLEALRQGMRQANMFGLAGAISPGGVHVAGGDFTILDAYDELRRQGQLTVRFYVASRMEPPAVSPEQIERIKDAQRRYHDEWISAGAAKFFLDGVIESHTAAMLAPYSDDPGQSGKLLWEPANYKQAVAELDRRGVQIYTHAIGDKAVRLALDAYEEAQHRNQTRDARPRIEHIESVSPQDIPRFGHLGVIASMQPLHAYPDDDLFKVWAPNVGPERTQRGFAWRSIESKGGVLAFGSDWPIVTLNPWPGVQNALTRQTTEGEPPGGFLPNERISLEDSIRAYTLNAAYAARRETEEGSLEAGKLADLIILNQDLFKIEPTDIAKTEVWLTMVGGKVVYESPQWKAQNADSKAEGK